ncbi:uncharacterized protein LOC133736633 isoform X2 [Rosa rugosa]|uniref:uncharacterized protein LOC133736633 isoform X2 n=1 Tax=Rosa rugosa TaxID=74645 RepID=UPI002B415DA0|nr:uncharacterized protein LOC133736633 isoform X2 [Rosa rugosa]
MPELFSLSSPNKVKLSSPLKHFQPHPFIFPNQVTIQLFSQVTIQLFSLLYHYRSTLISCLILLFSPAFQSLLLFLFFWLMKISQVSFFIAQVSFFMICSCWKKSPWILCLQMVWTKTYNLITHVVSLKALLSMKEEQQDYQWALEMFSKLLGADNHPVAIITDRELALMKAIQRARNFLNFLKCGSL